MDTKFHISLPCRHIEATEKFYTQIIGVSKGRKAQNWVDINLFGHQITFNKSGTFKFNYPNYVFEKTVLPSFHFGIILQNEGWERLYKKMKTGDFLYIDKSKFLAAKHGEHKSFFLKDPNGYIIEFKCFADPDSIFEG